MAQTTSTIRKTAYAALGLPSQIVKTLRSSASSMARETDETRKRLMSQVREIVDEWRDEGERITTSVTDRVKSRTGNAREIARERMEIAEDVTRGIAATFSNQVVPVEQIDGVGPAYAEALAKAGVVTTRALLERCDSPEAIERLSGQTGIGAGMIEGWAADADLTRVDGIGVAHMNLLNALGIGAVSQLAKQEPSDLRRRAAELDDEEFSPVPSEDMFQDWIEESKI